MEENLIRYLEWFAAVLLILAAVGSFFFRYTGFTRMISEVEALALTDSVVRQGEEGDGISADASLEEVGTNGRVLYPFRSGLVRVCDANEMRGIFMLAARDNVWDEPINVDGLPLVQLNLAGIPDDMRYRVTYSLDAEGSVAGTDYDSLPR